MDEKTCPIMSRPIVYPNGAIDNLEVPCLKDRCFAYIGRVEVDNDIAGHYVIPEGCKMMRNP